MGVRWDMSYSHVDALLNPAWFRPDTAGPEPRCRECGVVAPKLNPSQLVVYRQRGGLCPACAHAQGIRTR